MFYLKIIFLIFFTSIIYAKPLVVNEELKFEDLLPYSEIFIDKSKELKLNDIKTKDIKFEENNKKLLGYGFSPDFNVWIKFTLQNNNDKNIDKIIEYDNSLTSEIQFFNPDKNYIAEEEGLLHIKEGRKTLNPIFKITLKPKESKTYYIKASSHITTLIVKLNIWDSDSFFKKEIKRQIILSLFFGAMFILGIYNIFIYFFTKDISYLYYVLYIVGIIIHHLMYVGIANIYLLETNWIITIVELASVIVALPVYALGLFTKSFLQIEQYPINNKILNIFLILIPISILFFIATDGYDKYRNSLTMLFLIYLMSLTLYAAIKRNRQAYFILFGWFIFLASGMLMFLSSAGIFNVYKYFPYLIESSFVSEAIVFSIALANRINTLQKEKDEVNEKLIIQQQNETQILAKKVAIKTRDLKEALDEKSLLLKELNHRVKNNMQTIVSLIRLQNDEIDDDRLKDVLITIQNRINAMSHLHELLYKQDNISHINAYEYFDILIEEVKESYVNDINLYLDIQSDLKIEQAIYCGLILNELITNSFKYAFPDKKGNININLYKEKDSLKLIVKDDGIGYDDTISTDSLGLALIHTLAENQLRGKIDIDSSNGVTTTICWKDYD